SLWFLPLSAVLLPLGIGAAAGALLIPLRARRARHAREAYLGDLDEEVEGMLRILRARFDFEGAEVSVVPALRFRPSGAPIGPRGAAPPRPFPVPLPPGAGIAALPVPPLPDLHGVDLPPLPDEGFVATDA